LIAFRRARSFVLRNPKCSTLLQNAIFLRLSSDRRMFRVQAGFIKDKRKYRGSRMVTSKRCLTIANNA
jgi:hypothetical protein